MSIWRCARSRCQHGALRTPFVHGPQQSICPSFEHRECAHAPCWTRLPHVACDTNESERSHASTHICSVSRELSLARSGVAIPTKVKEDQTGRALLRVLHALQSASPVHLEAHAKNGQAPEATERRLSGSGLDFVDAAKGSRSGMRRAEAHQGAGRGAREDSTPRPSVRLC